MQSPTASDPSFKSFLDKLQEQNNRGFVTQLVQLKAEREIAGEDNDKREEQLDEVISSLKEVRSAVTGIKLDIDLTPLINIGENQTKLLDEIFKESSLTRKLTEGSVEYSKEMAGYRNTSGRDVTNEVSGKVSKTGQVIDFETARDALSAQGKRAKEANAFDLKPINYTPGKATGAAVRGREKPAAEQEEDKVDRSLFGRIKDSVKFKLTDGLSEKPGTGLFQTPSKDVEKKEREAKVSSPRQENPEADNIASTGEIEADAAKSDLEISKQMLDTTKAQLVELKAIREALAPDTPKDLVEKKSTPTAATEASDKAEGGGSLLGSLASAAMGLVKLGPVLLTAAAAIGAVATGAAVDYGLGKLGVGKDKEGNDLKIDKKQDDANFERMSVGQKIQSGFGRGIEKVGSALFLDNMSRQAQSDRVKNETEYFKDKDFVDSSGAQDEANYKEMSFGKKIRSSINRAGEKLSLFDSTKTTAARIRKETEELNKDAPGAATKEALAPAPATVKDQAPVALEEPDIKFRRSKRDYSTVGGRVVTGFEGGYNLHGKKEDVEEADAAWSEFTNAEDDATAEAAAGRFKTLAAKIQSPEYQEKMKSISKAQQEKKKTGVNPAKEEKVTGGPGAKDPAVPVPEALSPNQILRERDIARTKEKAALVAPSGNGSGILQSGQILDQTKPKTLDEIAMEEARKYGRDTPNFDDKQAAQKLFKGRKALEEANNAKIPVVEKKSVDTSAPGKASAVAPAETVDGKKIKSVTDVEKAQQAAKEKYQALTSEEKTASEKLKAFEKENQFDYREKPTIMQAFDDEPGTGKFKDPKKQEEYDKLKGTVRQASESKRSAGAAYTAAEGVTKTQDFTGGEQASRPGAKGGIRDEIDRKNDSMQSDGAKIRALQKRGYTDKDLGRDDTLTTNYIKDDEGKKYPIRNLGLYEAVVKKELDAPIDAKTKDGQVVPKETIDGKPAAVAARPKSVDEIAMAEAKKYGRDTPNIDDKKFAQKKVQTEALKTAGTTEGEFTGGALKKASDEDAKIYSDAFDNAGGEGLSAVQKKTLANDAVVAARAKRTTEQGSTVAQTSTENADMAREASGRGGANNTVVSNNVSSNNTTKFVPMKSSPRPEYTGSSLDRYTNRITVY